MFSVNDKKAFSENQKNWKKSNGIFHFLTGDQMKRRIDLCRILIEKTQGDRFFRLIVRTHKEWIYFRNPGKSGQWIDCSESKYSTFLRSG